MMHKYFIKTFGCQQNKADSERLAGDYAARGWQEAKNWREADQIVVNTCAVRQSAEDRVRGFLLNAVRFFAGKKRPKLILTGCMNYHGNHKLRELLPMVDEILPLGEVGFNQAALRKDSRHAWVPISEGCNSFCTYCIVPYSRGRERSRPEQDILAEITVLLRRGYSEITLLGQNVNSWGLEKVGIGLRKLLMDRHHPLRPRDLPSNRSQYLSVRGTPPFVKLLRKITRLQGLKRLRFMTSNPWDFSDALINEIAVNPIIDRFVHLPVQSGSNRILKLMNRGYTREEYLALVKKLRSAVPDVTLGTDLIVGFPTESEQDFQETISLARAVNWQLAFVARYSPRPGTAAFRLYDDDVLPAEKKRRWELLDKLINKSNLDNRPKVVK